MKARGTTDSKVCTPVSAQTALLRPGFGILMLSTSLEKKTAEEMTFSCWLQTHLSLLQGPEGDFGIPAGTLKSGRINPRLAVFEDAGPMPDPQRHRTQGCVRPGVAAGHLRWVAAGRVARGTRGSRPAWHGRTVPAAASEAASH